MKILSTLNKSVQSWFHMKCKNFEKHQYIIDKKYDENIMRLKCTKCQKKYGVKLDAQVIIAWNEDMELCLNIYENNLIEERRAAVEVQKLKIMYA